MIIILSQRKIRSRPPPPHPPKYVSNTNKYSEINMVLKQIDAQVFFDKIIYTL